MNHVFELTGLAAALATTLLATASCAQADGQKATVAPEVAALLDKMAKNRGPTAKGDDTAITIEGEFAVTFGSDPNPVAKGPFTEIFVGATLARQTMVAELGTQEKGVFRDVAWEVDPMLGAKVLRGGAAAQQRRYFALLRGADPRSLNREIVSEGQKMIDDREVTVLRLVAAEGPPATWHVDANGTLLRIETDLHAPESADAAFDLKDAMPATITFADWRDVDGGRFPMHRTLQMGKATVTSICKKVTIGTKIDAKKFEPPAAVSKAKLDDVGPAVDASGKATWQIVDRKAQATAIIRVKVAPADITKELAVLLPELHNHLVATGAKTIGPPYSRYHATSETEIDLEAGFPVAAPIEAKGRIVNGELPAGRTLTGWHTGSYEKLTLAHEALREHMTAQKLKGRGGPWEIYWTDPGMVPDPAKWRTQLFAPIE